MNIVQYFHVLLKFITKLYAYKSGNACKPNPLIRE